MNGQGFRWDGNEEIEGLVVKRSGNSGCGIFKVLLTLIPVRVRELREPYLIQEYEYVQVQRISELNSVRKAF